MKDIEVSIRFFHFKENTYLILSGKNNAKEVTQTISSKFPSYELLTNLSQTTPGDVFKFILNPIEDNLFSAGSDLSEKTLLTNTRSAVQKDVMCFEQNGKKLYTSVLCLQKTENTIDLDFINQLNKETPFLSWIKPFSLIKASVYLEQLERMNRLTSPNQNLQRQIRLAKDMATNGTVFFSYGLNIYVSAVSLQQLEVKKTELINQAKTYGLFFVSEKWNLPLAFYMGFPQYEMPRQFLFSEELFA